MFRDDFVWGVASSAYQVEGRDPQDGAGRMIWDTFTEEGGTLDGKGASVTCDHMHRYKEDYKLMRLLGVKAYRFSVSWSRIMPEGKRHNSLSDHVSLGISAGAAGQRRLAE